MRVLRRLQRAALRNSRRGASVFRATTIAAALSAVALSGCVEDSSSNDGDGAGAIDQKSIGLRAFNACAPLLDYYQAEAIAELEQGWDVGQPIAVGRDVPAAEPGIGAPTNDSAGGQGAAGGEDGGDNGGGAVAGVDYSETNNQEQGVDEPDIVKTDGEHIYTVRGGRLLIYAAGDLSLVGEAVLYGTWDSSQELLVRGDQAVVLGSHWGVPEEDFGDAEPEPGYRTIVAIYDISDRANPSLVRRLYVDGGLVAGRLTGRTARVVVHHQPDIELPWEDFYGNGGGASSGGSTGSGGAASGGSTPPSVDVDEPSVEPAPEPMETDPAAEPDLPEEMGQGQFPQQADEDPLAVLREAIGETELSDWVPNIYDAAGEARAVSQAARCERFFRPGERSGTGTTTVISIDLDDPTAKLDDPAVVTSAQLVYASSDNLYLTTVNYRDWAVLGGGDVAVDVGVGVATGGGTTDGPRTDVPEDDVPDPTDDEGGEDAPPPPEMLPPEMGQEESGQMAVDDLDDGRQATQIHRIDLGGDGQPASYEASGRVYGTVLNQFSLGEHDGAIRIATTEDTWGEATRSENHVWVLSGDEALTVTGHIGEIAPNERIYAVRFMGERGFVVTFERIDPLFTIDLSDANAPRIVGELKIPGFSTYLHPIDDDHLLGIGEDATDEGRVTGMQLSLFDVSDMADPQRTHKHALGQGWSEALYEHHAFTWWAPENLLLIPIESWDEVAGGAPADDCIDEECEWVEPEYRTGLELFGCTVDEGFEARGFIDHADLVEGRHDNVQRSLIIGDSIYSVGRVGMKKTALDSLESEAQAIFPEPVYNNDEGKGEPGIDGREPSPAEPPRAEPGPGFEDDGEEGGDSAGGDGGDADGDTELPPEEAGEGA